MFMNEDSNFVSELIRATQPGNIVYVDTPRWHRILNTDTASWAILMKMADTLRVILRVGSPPGIDSGFVVKDSGARMKFDSGMVRDTEDGKVNYLLALDGPMFERYAAHMTKGAKKYEERNWMKGRGAVEYERFRRSALRHMIKWLSNVNDGEDHAAAVIFNLNGAELMLERMVEEQTEKENSDASNPR